ncbi:hypothetical protein [Streptomyces sp. NPDC051546]|uniref:hypothetical protein n=1 Tax=Streptomyces sp. NPDC051546 TaxID=3365655 RepID=UPI0037B73B11
MFQLPFRKTLVVYRGITGGLPVMPRWRTDVHATPGQENPIGPARVRKIANVHVIVKKCPPRARQDPKEMA